MNSIKMLYMLISYWIWELFLHKWDSYIVLHTNEHVNWLKQSKSIKYEKLSIPHIQYKKPIWL